MGSPSWGFNIIIQLCLDSQRNSTSKTGDFANKCGVSSKKLSGLITFLIHMQPCPCIPSNSFGGSPPFPPGLLVYNPPWLVWYTWETHLCKKIALSWKSNNYRSQNGRSPFQWRNARRGVLKLNISPCRTHITFSSRAGIQVQVLLHVTSQEYSCFDEIKLKNSFCDHPCVNFPSPADLFFASGPRSDYNPKRLATLWNHCHSPTDANFPARHVSGSELSAWSYRL